MGNKRKTRKEKVIADLRRQLYSFKGQDVVSSEPKVPLLPKTWHAPPTLVNTYPYLTSDVLKTGILTMLILACQIILFLILKNHVIKLPGVVY